MNMLVRIKPLFGTVADSKHIKVSPRGDFLINKKAALIIQGGFKWITMFLVHFVKQKQ